MEWHVAIPAREQALDGVHLRLVVMHKHGVVDLGDRGDDQIRDGLAMHPGGQHRLLQVHGRGESVSSLVSSHTHCSRRYALSR